MTSDTPSILIVGAGAVGALFGSALARQGARVAVVCRSDYDVVRRDGYDIRSPLLGDHRFRPTQCIGRSQSAPTRRTTCSSPRRCCRAWTAPH